MFYININPEILHQVGSEIQMLENQYSLKLHQLGAELDGAKLHQAEGEFPLLFAFVPWRHHVEIITKCETIEKALFYKTTTLALPPWDMRCTTRMN